MKARHLLVIGLTLAALTGCGSEPPTAPAPAPTTTKIEGPTEAQLEAAAIAAGIPPKPDAETRAAYLAALDDINPEIIGDHDPDRIVDRGRDQCRTFTDWPGDRDKQLIFLNTRFSSPEHPEGFGPATATRIEAVIREHLCPTY